MSKRNEDKNAAFPGQCREGKDTETRCWLRGVFTSALSGGISWRLYHATIHRDHWPADKQAFCDWLAISQENGSLGTNFPCFVAGEYTSDDLWEAVCGRKLLPIRERAPIDKGVRDRRLVELVVGGAFHGEGRGLVQKILDHEITVEVALAEITKAANKIAAESEAVGF